jgi:hypothetical protein
MRFEDEAELWSFGSKSDEAEKQSAPNSKSAACKFVHILSEGGFWAGIYLERVRVLIGSCLCLHSQLKGATAFLGLCDWSRDNLDVVQLSRTLREGHFSMGIATFLS